VHEVGLVAELVDVCLARAGSQPVARVVVRHASTTSEEAIRQAFEMLTAGGPLGDTELVTTPVAVTLRCECGFEGPLGPDHEAGGHLVCPDCGSLHRAPRTAELELLAIEPVEAG
jgi:Zn finger protein HypA/HybF involved in hydrogenase expression